MPTYRNAKFIKAAEDVGAALDAMPDSSHPLTYKKRDPAEFMKYMDTSFESFFYQRVYSEKNFSFYLQVLASQGKPEEALKAFRRMEAMNIQPTDNAYNQLMRGFARRRDLTMVEKLNEEATTKYGILPSKHRYNNLMLCYAKMNQP